MMDNELIVQADQGTVTISRHIYGHFAEHLGRGIYGGFWVGEDATVPHVGGVRADVIEALKALHIPNLRWPGGCFADEYHWRDGIGPLETRPTMINTHWGGVTENNHFGTHEFLDLCQTLDCAPYVCGNLGSGTVQEMAEWIEYMNFDGVSPRAEERRRNGREVPWRVAYFAVGNENWGCGGNMRAQYYADLYRRYATYCRDYSGNTLFRIAGPHSGDTRWIETLLQEVPRGLMQGISLHYYAGEWPPRGSATQFDEGEWFHVLALAAKMEDFLKQNGAILDFHDPQRRIGLIVDEWGAWHAVEPGTNPGFLYQQNSLRDALVAGMTLNLFNNHAHRVHMANLAQTINVLQAVLLTEGDKLIKTPTYHVFDLYQVHQDATLLPTRLRTVDYAFEERTLPVLNASASKDIDGAVHISLCNIHPTQPQPLTIHLRGADGGTITGRTLTAPVIRAHNTGDAPETVRIQDFSGAQWKDGAISVELPARSVTLFRIRKESLRCHPHATAL